MEKNERKDNKIMMMKIMDLLLLIRERTYIYYHKDTNQFDGCPISAREMEHISFDEKIPYKDLNNIRLPSYEEIDHKDIMSFYVREFVEDKEIRKQLFYTLRRSEYIDAFIDKLREFNLYDDFVDACEDIYIQIFEEWAEENELDFKKK